METKKVSQKVFDEAKAKKPRAGKYKAIIEQVQKTGEPIEVSGLTRGQVSAFSRIKLPEDIEAIFSYKDQKVYLAKKVK